MTFLVLKTGRTHPLAATLLPVYGKSAGWGRGKEGIAMAAFFIRSWLKIPRRTRQLTGEQLNMAAIMTKAVITRRVYCDNEERNS